MSSTAQETADEIVAIYRQLDEHRKAVLLDVAKRLATEPGEGMPDA